VRPRLDVPQASGEGQTRGLEVEILDVEDLEARLLELGDAGVRILADEGEPPAPCEEAAVRVRPAGELDLADPFEVGLLAERRVRVLPRVERGGEGRQGRG